MTTPTPTWREQPSPGPPTGAGTAPGTVVGNRYELRTPIGNGGMGTVWRAADLLLRRDVAVKEVVLPGTMPKVEQEAICERTMREARAAAALSHPSVVQVYDVVTDDSRPWIVMELLEARSLADIVIEDGPLSQRGVAKIGLAMLGALEVAHAAGVLHRDVKPANVLICADGRCVLTDFGVARLPTESKLTTPGMVLGSPHFISPERAVGGTFGPPSDLFSLGVTLYTAVEGGPPFDRGDPFETMRAVVEEAPRPPRLAGPLQPVILGLLDKEPGRRWNVERARMALRELLAGPLSRPGRPATAPTPRPPGPHAGPSAGPPAGPHHGPSAGPPAGPHHGPSAGPPAGPHHGPPHGPPPGPPLGPQHAPHGPPPAHPPGPGGPAPAILRSGVGGRAMLDPSEPLTGQLARLRGTTRSGAPTPMPGTDGWTTAPARRGRRRRSRGGTAVAHHLARRAGWLTAGGRLSGRTLLGLGLALVLVGVAILVLT